MSIVHKTDYADNAEKSNLFQWRNSVQMIKYQRVFASLFQDIEDAAWEILYLRSIENGQGVQLDVIGKIVGRGRNGLSDDDYKIGLRTQIRINRSSGEIIDFEEVLLISVPDLDYEISEPSAARIQITIVTPISAAQAHEIFANLKQTKALGVKLGMLWTGSIDAFVFGSIGDIDPTNTIDGFSTIALTSGGAWDSLETT